MISHEAAMAMSIMALEPGLEDKGLLVLPIMDKHIVIMSSLGIFDEDGVEIFEGDIIETSSSLKRDSSGEFSEDKYLWCYHSSEYLYGRLMPSSGKVVGNIFTNNDLMDKISNKE
jgi:hypothetical protein